MSGLPLMRLVVRVPMDWMRFGLVPGVVAATAVVLAGSACGGPATTPHPPGSSPGSGECLGAQRLQCLLTPASPVTVTVPSARLVTSQPRWPERGIVLAEANNPALASASQVLDPAAGVLYALVPTPPDTGSVPYVLEAIDLRTGRFRRGESYQAYALALASGSLWVSGYSGPGGHPVLVQANPRTLATVRSVPLPGPSTLAWVVAAGPPGSVWAAVPDGVWVWFRTGMLGQSGLLRARSLSVVGGFPTTFRPADSPTTGIGTVYDWAMSSNSAYGRGALWVATSGGLLACVNPVTGQVRAQETVVSGQAISVYAMAADRTAREVVAVIGTTSNTTGVMTVTLETITPPRDCWG